MAKPTMLFLPSQTRIETENHASVLSVALSGAVPVEHSCGGMGSCGTCRVIVQSSLTELGPRTEIEAEMAQAREFSLNERLACQLEPYDGLVVRLPDQRTKKGLV